jgi:Ca2+-binding RTX toxin-like protein
MAAPTLTTTYNVDENSTFVQLLADDTDLDTLAFSIVSGTGDDSDKFTIDALTGELTFIGGTDFENPEDEDGNNVYTLTIAVDDGTGNVTTETITINIDNIVGATITGTTGDDVLDADDGATDEEDTIDGGLGADTMLGGNGNDIYIVDNAGDLVDESLSDGVDEVRSSISYTLGTGVENLVLTGTAGLAGTGNGLANTLTGNSGANILDGKGNADRMIGGNGNDKYIVNNAGDVVVEAAGLSAGSADVVESSVSITSLWDNVERLTLTGSSAIDGTGNTLANIITGNSGVNVLTGLGGNDTLDGGLGADTLVGGTGSDTYVVDNTGDVVTEGTDPGLDTVKSSVTIAALWANVENITLTGSAAISATGNELANKITGNSAINTLNGGDGNDTLDGGLGADKLKGGAGNDTYIVNSGDVITENSGAGKDTVKANFTFSIASIANVENLELTGSGNINGTGNALNNILTGNLGSNTLTGGDGDDTYYINGSASVTDTVVEGSGAGNDMVIVTNGTAGMTFTLAANVENMNLSGLAAINATGNALDNEIAGNSANNVINGDAGNDTITAESGNDTLTGGEGNDSLDGGIGNDSMTGGNGDDTYFINVVGDTITEGSGGTTGTDTVVSTMTNYTLQTNLENLTLGGASAINGNGNSVANVITGNKAINGISGGDGNDTINGGAGADVLNGDGGADTIVGGGGGDTIDGGAGADEMNGGAGIDTFVFSSVSDANGDIISGMQSGEIIDLSALGLTMDDDDVIAAGEVDTVVDDSGLTTTVTVNIYTDGDSVADSSFTFTLADGVGSAEITFLL